MIKKAKKLFFGVETFFIFLSVLMLVAGQAEAVWGIVTFLAASSMIGLSVCYLIGELLAETIVCAKFEDTPLVIFATIVMSLFLSIAGAVFQSVLSVWLVVPSLVLVVAAALVVLAVVLYELFK